MRQKLSVSIEEDTLRRLDELLKDVAYRNKSHVVEMALQKFLEDNYGD